MKYLISLIGLCFTYVINTAIVAYMEKKLKQPVPLND